MADKQGGVTKSQRKSKIGVTGALSHGKDRYAEFEGPEFINNSQQNYDTSGMMAEERSFALLNPGDKHKQVLNRNNITDALKSGSSIGGKQ